MAGTVVHHPSQLRTLAFVGPAGSGKSSLFTQLTKLPDHIAVEIWGTLRAATVEHSGVVITMLDPSGGPDFDADVQAALRAVDNVVFVISADAGVDAATITLWHQCAQRRIPRCVVVTHLDDGRGDYDEIVAICQRVFGSEVVALHYPVLTDEESLGGFIDILTMQIHDHSGSQPTSRPADPEHVALLTPARQRIGEALLGTAIDPTVIDAIVNEGVLESPTFAHEVIRAIALGEVAPVLVAGSSPRGLGSAELVDFFASSLAAPPHSPRLTVTDLTGDPVPPITTDPDGPLCAQVIAAPESGDDGDLIRIFSGTLRPGAVIRIRAEDVRTATIGALRYPSIEEHLDEAVAGSIVIAQCADGLAPADTVAAPNHVLRIEPWPVALPLHSVRVHHAPIEAVRSMLTTDRAVRMDGDVLWCMGEQHATHLLVRLREHFGDTVDLVPVFLRLRETVARSATVPLDGVLPRAEIAVTPLALGRGLHIDINCGAPALDHFVEEVLADQAKRGPLAGFPVTDVAITGTATAKPDLVPSKTLATSIRAALDEALRRGEPYLLEPLMQFTVRVPRDDVDTVTSDIERRRGLVLESTEEPGGTTLIVARAPEGEMTRYAIEIGDVCEGGVLCDLQSEGFTALPKYLAERYASSQFDSSNSRV
jgi:elongation factor G